MRPGVEPGGLLPVGAGESEGRLWLTARLVGERCGTPRAEED